MNARNTPTLIAPMNQFKADYSRQQRLSGFGSQGQEKLRDARVLIIGAGGLGCAVVPILAGAGVGHLEIVDHDQVDASNLHRQTIYRADQVGRPKADLAAEYAMSLNPEISATAHAGKLSAVELLNRLSEADLVLECTDDFNHKMRVNDAAVLLGKPAVFANAVSLEGQLQTFSGDRHCPCLRCLWQQVPASAMTCDAHGVLGSVPAFIGNLQANEALHVLTGIGDGLQQRVLYFDAVDYRQRLFRLKLSEDCHLHKPDYGREDFLTDHDSVEFCGTLAEALSKGMLVVDIRDEPVRSLKPLCVEHQCIPSSNLLDESADAIRLLEGKVLLVCYKGRTSLSVAAAMRGKGYSEVYSMAGGAEGAG